MRADLLLSIQRLKEQATTVRLIGSYPPHIARLSAWHVQRLLKEKAIQLPKDADGVRVMFELTNNGALSSHSHQFICDILREIKVPPMSRQEMRLANDRMQLDYAIHRKAG